MRTFLLTISVILFTAAFSFAQPRPVERSVSTTPAKTAPQSFEAKYEGGMFGFSKKETGTLKFDDEGERLVFYGEDKKELFGIPYDALLVIYPESKSVTSTTGQVVSHVPVPGSSLGSLIKEKRQYLVCQFRDPDVDASGLVNFKLDDKELLVSVLQALGQKAKLQQRGDAYYRPRN